MDTVLIVWTAVGVALVALVVLLVSRSRRTRRTQALKDRFGAEYDRTVAREGSRSRAESELAERQRRHDRVRLRTLDDDERQTLHGRWEDVQASFVDGPESAVRNAEVILDDAARARGYPDADREQRLRDLAVDHSDEVHAYREATPSSKRKGDDGEHAEQLRRELLAARALFEALVGPPPKTVTTSRPADRTTPPAGPAATDTARADGPAADARSSGAPPADEGPTEPPPPDAEPTGPARHPLTGGEVDDSAAAEPAPEAPFDRVLGEEDEPPPPPRVV